MLSAGGPVRLGRRCQTTERCFGKHWQSALSSLFCFFKFTGQRFNFSASLSGPSSLLLSIKRKPCLWVRLPGPCLDSAGTGYRLSTLLREFSGDGQRRRVTPRLSSKKTAPPGGGSTPPCPGPRFAFSLLLSPRLLPSPPSRPLHCLLFYITHFYSPCFPARTFSLRVSLRAMRRRCQG